jgi:uncharacterized protein YjeT (DUF2065 family)
MQWSIFISAIGLLFVFEGILPFLSPRFWRNMMLPLLSQPDRAIRVMGLVSMLLGLLLVSAARGFF